MEKPIIVLSACLEFEKVRYNGQNIPSRVVRDLMPFAEFIKVCPEFAIGLGVPRQPIRFVRQGESLRLVQHETNRDVTDDMDRFASGFLDSLTAVDGFIFKSKSPTMGVGNIKVYSGMKGSPVVARCGGFFAGRITDRFPGYPIEEEDRLRNKRIRDHFLTKVFLFAGYRRAVRQNQLDEFHDRNRLLLEFYNPERSAKMDPSRDDYFAVLKEITQKPPATEETARFFERLIGEQENLVLYYRQNRISADTLKVAARTLVKDRSLLEQTFFAPFPDELIAEAEDDRDRDYWHNIG